MKKAEKMSRKQIALLMLAVLILTGCSSKPCFGCNSWMDTKSCYNVNNPQEVRHYCEDCLPRCNLCWIQRPFYEVDAVRYKIYESGGIMWFCESCDPSSFDSIVESAVVEIIK